MTFEQFCERIRIGIRAGVYTNEQVLKLLSDKGYQTTRDVPEEQRHGFFEILDNSI